MEDFSIICRCCLIKADSPKHLIPLFIEHDGIFIPNILKSITTLLIEENDNLPQMICKSCTDTIYKVSKLIAITIESDNKLRGLLADQSVPKNLKKPEPIIHSVFLSDDISSCDEGETKKEVQIPTADEFSCCMCASVFKTKTDLLEHVAGHTKPKLKEEMIMNPVECKMCLKRFCSQKNYKLHLKRKYLPKTKTLYQCKHCGRVFSTQGSLKLCEQKHSGTLPSRLICDICSLTLATRSGLVKHMQTHMSDIVKNHACDFCGKCFRNTSELKRHMLVHTKIRDHHCNLCGNSFLTTSALAVHNRIHTGERPYTCPFLNCGKTFIHITDSKVHQMSHTGERPHACSQEGCTKQFRTKTLLRSHERVHTGVKDFKCKLCEAEYYRARSLKRHMTEKH